MKTVIVYGMNNVVGGIESYLLNLYRCIYKNIKFVFFVENVTDRNSFIYKDEIEQHGGSYEFLPDHHRVKEYIKQFKKLLKKYKDECEIIYVNFNNIAFDIVPINIAMRQKYKIITHSHNAMQEPIRNWKYRTRNNILRNVGIWRLSRLKVERLAVSKSAGEYLYAKRAFKVFFPGIDTNKYSFNEKMRKDVRESLALHEAIVVGFVGRIVAVKNPLFLIDILKEMNRASLNAKLLIVGDGIMKDELSDLAKSSGFEKNIIFVGVVKNVQDYLQAMDVLVAPSLSEGMPLAVAEAQSIGVPCICAKKNIPKKVDVTGSVVFCELENGGKGWSSAIQKILVKGVDREAMNLAVKKSTLNIENASMNFLKIVEKMG